jgi:hypothetical protein
MTASPLSSALRAGAEGLCALEAATGLVIAHGSWLIRDDFARFIQHGSGTAAIDWAAAMTALDEGGLPGSAGRGGCWNWPPAWPATGQSDGTEGAQG